MTYLVTLISLVPIRWSYGRGSEIMLPMALPTIGGMFIDQLSPFMVPGLYAWYWEWRVGGNPTRATALGPTPRQRWT